MTRTAGVVICGAGITGVSAADFLSKAGIKDILLLDERPPLSLQVTGLLNAIGIGGPMLKCLH